MEIPVNYHHLAFTGKSGKDRDRIGKNSGKSETNSLLDNNRDDLKLIPQILTMII